MTMTLKYDETPTIYVDVDGTMVFWPGADPGEAPIPWTPELNNWPAINIPLVDALKAWRGKGGRCLVIWSRAGARHARQMAQFCGLSADAYLPKPRMAIDDKPHTVEAGHAKGFEVLAPGEVERIIALG